ncbi:hypothetical protein [Polynucleobacter sp. CS-Odin-A6]|uniref:hypothetical protein n=1 Tax=Polynucleobacter sp. CS-Odin-A6 TaxID=2689106 RepID=UPI001C0DA2D4|nr:hypothetical protein [Polynucleobacter sp. CS-Odin-A6]MBU3620374.1 hypothetical protein [Polynucleobacter sp. CS-Odin-A6]
MMNDRRYATEDDEYFDLYTNSLTHDLLKERLIWQHQVCKQIDLEYEFIDDDLESC